MASYFFDSSALVKRYTQEVGSEWVKDISKKYFCIVYRHSHTYRHSREGGNPENLLLLLSLS